MWFLNLKVYTIVFGLFLTGCLVDFKAFQKKVLKFRVFKKPLSCNEIYKNLYEGKRTKKKREKIEEQAENCLEQGKVKLAFLILEMLLKRNQVHGASIMEIKRLEKKLARLFYSTEDYRKALKYYTSLLRKPLGPGEKFFVQYRIADSFFNLEKYEQALREIDKCFFDGISVEQDKKARLLKGRVFIAKKQFDRAISFFEKQIETFPQEESFFREYLALVYEFKKDFSSAVQELEKIKSSNSFVKRKIKDLYILQSQQGIPSQ